MLFEFCFRDEWGHLHFEQFMFADLAGFFTIVDKFNPIGYWYIADLR